MKKILYLTPALITINYSAYAMPNTLDSLASEYNGRLSPEAALEIALEKSMEDAFQEDLNKAIQDSLIDQKLSLLDVLVIGSGPSAHAFAANAMQDKINVALIMGDNPGGAINVKTTVKNFSGPKEKYGFELMYDWISKSEELGVPMLQDSVDTVDLTDSIYTVYMKSGKSYKTKSVVFAQGTKPRPLQAKNVENVKIWEDDAWFQIGEFKRAAKNKNVLIVGSGIDSVNKIKNVIEGGAKKVYIALRSTDIPPHIREIQELFKDKIEIISNKTLEKIQGSGDKIESVEMTDKSTYDIDMIVNATGRIGNDNIDVISKDSLKKDDQSGRLIVGTDMMTNLPGVFAIGDIAAQLDSFGNVIHDDGRAIIAIGKGASGERGVARYLAKLKK